MFDISDANGLCSIHHTVTFGLIACGYSDVKIAAIYIIHQKKIRKVVSETELVAYISFFTKHQIKLSLLPLAYTKMYTTVVQC